MTGRIALCEAAPDERVNAAGGLHPAGPGWSAPPEKNPGAANDTDPIPASTWLVAWPNSAAAGPGTSST
ncbi:hypothetical protein [Actinoplanes sp. TFC3]|uniref:hypothetical protein n=1 Tax=Actinoplanes sp. TFC3 TaxID=1710355 RepID=UPI00137B146D|nr:hypothetical protein [Actinoplanes sp. TFC3]